MTLKELEQIFALRSEINLLKKRMEKMQQKGDFVGDYGFKPNRGRPFTIQGYAAKDEPKFERAKKKMIRQVSQLESTVGKAKSFIESVPDTTVRVLLSARFVDGMTWKQAASVIYTKMSEDAARKRVAAYFTNT